jgi:uncharacterized membrane-anchored protein
MLILMVANGLIAQKEYLIAQGEPVYIALAPVDPRSIMQGDYMSLRYDIDDEAEDVVDWPQRGQIVVQLDERQVADYVRRYTADVPLQPDERLLNYRIQNDQLVIGPDSFFFQEKQAELYQEARFAEVRLTNDGTMLLLGLRDENLVRLGPVE